jgi:hypothetical protein
MIPDDASPEFIGCVLTCLSSGDVDTYTLFMCVGGCYAATYLGDTAENENDTESEQGEKSEDE